MPNFDNYASLTYLRRLSLYPDCRDPQHPGCEQCNGADAQDDQDLLNEYLDDEDLNGTGGRDE